MFLIPQEKIPPPAGGIYPLLFWQKNGADQWGLFSPKTKPTQILAETIVRVYYIFAGGLHFRRPKKRTENKRPPAFL